MLTELQMTRFITCIFVMYICMGVHGEVEAHTHTWSEDRFCHGAG